MSRAADLDRLLALRALRERRAEQLAAQAQARLDAAQAAQRQAEDAVTQHDTAEGLREARLHDAMILQGFTRAELDDAHDRTLHSALRRQMLGVARARAEQAAQDALQVVEARNSDWRRATLRHSKLETIARPLAQRRAIRAENLTESETEDMIPSPQAGKP